MPKDFLCMIVIPTNGQPEAKTMMSLAGLTAYFSNKIPGYDNQSQITVNKRGSILPQLRQRAVNEALKAGATHLLFIDSDMTYPKDTLHRMAAHDRPVVACNCATKTIPSNPTARLKEVGNPAGRLVYSHNARGLQRVWRVGTGVMLIRLSAIKHIPRPHFEVRWNEELQDHMGEDWWFCEQLERHGVALHIDHDLSREIGHIGSYTYTHDDIATAQLAFGVREDANREDDRQLALAI